MQIRFPYAGYEEIAPVEIPDTNLFTKQQAERLGFRYALTPQQALEMAFERKGRAAKIAVLQHGGHILPLIDNEANAA